MTADEGKPNILGRVLRLPLTLIPTGTPMPILRGPLRGKRWMIGYSQHGWWLGSHEMDKQIAFAKQVKPNDVVYDLGANIGFYSVLAGTLVGKSGRVHSFEPLADNVRLIQRHLDLNHIKNCDIHTCAVSDVTGFATFETSPVSHTMGHLSESDGLRVPVTTLDEIVASGAAQPPNVIKCDIEGAELAMFKGARNVIEKYKPIIFLATHSVELRGQCLEFLRAAGYKLESIDSDPLEKSDEILAIFPG